jgi:tyrosine decarboxylase
MTINKAISQAMDSNEFRKRGTEMVEYICQYLETIEDRKVTPSVEPGYLRQLIPGEAPHMPEPWEKIMEDVETKIMPGVTHWQHPRFHAYFPSGNSFPSILGDMLGDAIGCIGFSWVSWIEKMKAKLIDIIVQQAASPACTELETIVLDWLGESLEFFLKKITQLLRQRSREILDIHRQLTHIHFVSSVNRLCYF